MSEYSAIRDAIQRLGASVAEEHLCPENFGSAYCVFEVENQPHFRLVWDGKEGYGFLQSQRSTGLWKDIGPYVADTADQNSKFIELLAVAKELICGNVSV